jgi:hypothetical protein
MESTDEIQTQVNTEKDQNCKLVDCHEPQFGSREGSNDEFVETVMNDFLFVLEKLALP